jgi:ankyrin repeat protein
MQWCVAILVSLGNAFLRCEVDVTDNAGNTPLYIACRWGHTDIAQALLVNKASVTGRNKDGNTPLHIACEWGYTDIVQTLLVASKASVIVQNNDENRPLHIACSNGNISVVQLLLDSGANANIQW